jgi:hypothetical protein
MKGQRRCSCGVCVYCKNHDRYISERDLRKKRSMIRNLQEKESLGLVRKVMNSFVDGEIGLDEFLEAIDGE